MKQIIDYLDFFRRAHFDLVFVGILGLFLAVSLWMRYAGGFVPTFQQHSWAIGKGIAFYATPYFFTLILYSTVYQRFSFWYKFDFWLLSGGILFVLYANQYGLYYESWVKRQDYASRFWLDKMSFNLHSAFFYLLIPLIYGFYKAELYETRLYGCTTEKFNFLPYFWLFLAMMPLLVWASFQSDFLKSYPRYRPNDIETSLQISPFTRVLVYEITYIVQFLALEIFFRGFIVMALGKFIGGFAVFPMVAVYCFLHFFKPMPEALGSIFGGLILGIIAWYSRSVIGGMFIHVAVALMMELLAFGQIYRKIG